MYYLVRAIDSEILEASSSGGFVRLFLAAALKHKVVDALVLVKHGKNPFEPEVEVRTDDAFLDDDAYGSVYMKAYPLEKLREVPPQVSCGVVLLPCQVECLRRLQRQGYLCNVKLVVGLVCNHVPSPDWMRDVLRTAGIASDDVESLRFRAGKWPGRLTVVCKDGRLERSFPQGIWNNTDYLEGPCVRCGRVFSNGADVVAGDPWGGVGHAQTMVKVVSAKARRLFAKLEEEGVAEIERASPEVFDKCVSGCTKWKERRTGNHARHDPDKA